MLSLSLSSRVHPCVRHEQRMICGSRVHTEVRSDQGPSSLPMASIIT